MGKGRRLHRVLAKRFSLIAPVKVVLMLVVLVYATNITITSKPYQAQIGSAVTVANGLLATDKGFALATSGASPVGTNCSSPVVFGPTAKTANTTITAGHLTFDVQVNSTLSAVANTKFNVTFTLSSTNYGPLCIQTPASPLNGQTIDCRFDVGTSLPTSPYSFKVTVQ